MKFFSRAFSLEHLNELILIIVDFTFTQLKFVIDFSGTPSKYLDEFSFAFVVFERASEVAPVTP